MQQYQIACGLERLSATWGLCLRFIFVEDSLHNPSRFRINDLKWSLRMMSRRTCGLFAHRDHFHAINKAE
jgi:hypothetical protein